MKVPKNVKSLCSDAFLYRENYKGQFFVGDLVWGKVYKTFNLECFSGKTVENNEYLCFLGFLCGEHPWQGGLFVFAKFLVLTGKKKGEMILRALAENSERPREYQINNFFLCLEEVKL